MGERDITAEVLEGLHEIREHRAGKRTLRVTRVEVKSVAELQRVDAARAEVESG